MSTNNGHFKYWLKIFCIGLGWLLLFHACDSEQPKPASPNQLQQMSVVRERLIQQLGEKYDEPVSRATSKQLARGGQLYSKLCATCHGVNGKANGKIANGLAQHPTDFTDPKEATFFSEQARLEIIRKGIPETAMMGWGNVLSEQDILAVYGYIRAFSDD